MSYENVTFKKLSEKRVQAVRETIASMWAEGFTTTEISKKTRIGKRSVATAVGNFERLVSKQPTHWSKTR